VLHEARLWPEYHPGYYGGFVRDPDGNNVEAVCHRGLTAVGRTATARAVGRTVALAVGLFDDRCLWSVSLAQRAVVS
jgi:hypothetical protein